MMRGFSVILLILCASFSFANNDPSLNDYYIYDEVERARENTGNIYQSKAKIIGKEDILPDTIQKIASENIIGGFQYQIRITEGEFASEVTEIQYYLYKDLGYQDIYQVGDDVVMIYNKSIDQKPMNIQIIGRDRSLPIIILFAIFVVGVLALGRLKGLRSLLALGITVAMIFIILVPGILNNFPPVWTAIGVAVLSTVATFLILSGFCKKSFAAILGSALGFLTAGLIAVIFGNWFAITGMMDEKLLMLYYIRDFRISDLIFSGILIGCIGAVMDVAVSIASTVEELRSANPNLTKLQLLTSSLNVGKDVLGTMVNTLILAYIGSSLPLVLLIIIQYGGNTPFMNILSLEVIAEEILRSMAGSIGMMVTIPATAFLSAFLFYGKAEKPNKLQKQK